MSNYKNTDEEYDFSKLVEDDAFKGDLVKFFSGGRYEYTKEDMMERGFEGLTEDFVEHMRYQSWNEVEAVRDLSYVRNKDYNPEGKRAFGRLTDAWDKSSTAGSGFGDSVGDFAGAVLTAPSTYLGLGSFGLGKLGAKAAVKGTQVAVRFGLKEALETGVVKKAVKRSALREAGKDAVTGTLTGMGLGAIQAGAQGETREIIVGTEYTRKDLLFDSLVGGVTEGALGGALGYASGVIGRGRTAKVDDILLERKDALRGERERATTEAIGVVTKATDVQKKVAMKTVSDLEEVLSARAGVKGARVRDRLDPERVAKGKAMLNAMSDPKADPVFASGLSADTMRKIAAVSIDLMQNEKLGIKDGERITSSVSRAMSEDTSGEVFGFLDATRKKYGLTKDEFSLIYLAEVSQAGQTLGFASAIKRGVGLGGKNLDELTGANALFEKGGSSMTGDELAQISSQAIRNSKYKDNPIKGRAYAYVQDLDAMRIAFMTSQPVTTMRNLRNSGILIATDLVDETNRALYKGLTGDPKAIKDFIPRATALLRGYSTNNAEAKVIRSILLEEGGEQYKRLFNDAMRVDVGLEGQTVMAGAGRIVNTFNTVTDSVLKEGMFYGALDRQFIEKYDSSLKNWLKANKSFDDLPAGISVDEAIETANRFTMQRTFRDDESAVGKLTKAFVRANRQVPFLVSEGLGVPFPRYVGNHLQMVAEYTPVIGEILQRKGVVSKTEDIALLRGRQMTGAMMLFGGYTLAEMRQGEADYGSIKNTVLNTKGMTEDANNYAGAAIAHMYVGDIIWRRMNGLPGEVKKEEVLDVLGGIPDFAFDIAVMEALWDYSQTGETEDLEKEMGKIISTFTYPGVIAKDIYGQLNPDAAGTSFVRDLALTNDISLKGTKGTGSGIILGQSTRMLMDADSIQYTQSFNGKNDIKVYKFSNPVATGTVDPFIKQITGSFQEPPMTEMEMEMAKYGLKGWQLYNRSTVPNANVDLLLQRRLARGSGDKVSLAEEFNSWRQEPNATKRFGKASYDDIVASGVPTPQEKADVLEGFIKKRIKDEYNLIEEAYEGYANSPEYRNDARGFIRNNYIIQQKKYGKNAFDKTANRFGFESADAMLADSETTQEEINRRMALLGAVKQFLPDDIANR